MHRTWIDQLRSTNAKLCPNAAAQNCMAFSSYIEGPAKSWVDAPPNRNWNQQQVKSTWFTAVRFTQAVAQFAAGQIRPSTSRCPNNWVVDFKMTCFLFSVCFFFFPSLSSFMLRPSMCIYIYVIYICNIYVIYIYICIHTLWIYVYNYVLKFYGWVTISLELCSTHHVYCSNPHLCVGVWVGKLQWIAVNHVQCTFFSFVKLPFMHVWSTYFGLCSL